MIFFGTNNQQDNRHESYRSTPERPLTGPEQIMRERAWTVIRAVDLQAAGSPTIVGALHRQQIAEAEKKAKTQPPAPPIELNTEVLDRTVVEQVKSDAARLAEQQPISTPSDSPDQLVDREAEARQRVQDFFADDSSPTKWLED